jgi:UDP-N-acetyl-2-amino-2-deoxyglucuronate dehydrogenase
MKHRVGIIGLGMASQPHLAALAELASRVEIAAAFTPSEKRRASFAVQLPLVDSIDAIAKDASIQSVLVLTPPNTHLELVSQLAGAGKHILLEKPLATTLPDAEAVVRIGAERKVTLGVVLQHRHRPGPQRLAALMREGVPDGLGELMVANISVPWWRAQSYYSDAGRGTRARDGGGVLLTQAIHLLDLYLSVVGEVTDMSARVLTTPIHQMECEDHVAATLRFARGAVGTLTASTAMYPGFAERIELIGTRGSAILEAGALKVWRHGVDAVESVGAEEASGGGANPMAFSHAAHRALLEDFIDAVEQGRAPLSDGAAALKVHRFIERLLAASE